MSDHESTYVPKTGVEKWLDDRLPIIRFSKEHLMDFPTPKNLNYWWTFGAILTLCLATQIVTGIVLAMHYDPSAANAFNSVEHIMRDVNYGWLIRYIHANGASMFFIAVYIHMLRGGFSVGNPTLNRFFSLHYLLPFVIAAIVVLHIWALHVPGNNNPVGVDVKDKRDTLPFHPYYTMKDAFGMVVFLIPFVWFAFFAPDILGHPDNYIQFSSTVTPAHIVPEWYFLPFYAILRAIDFNILFIDSKLGGVIFFGGSILILFFLPWLDTSKVRSGNFRPMFKWFYWLFVVNFVALTYLGAAPAEGIYVVLAKICTAYYFIHFLVILPLLGRIETPRPLPTSISESVLGKSHA